MAHGHLDPHEESELLEVLGKVAGGPPGSQPSVSGAIPFDDPPPTIEYLGQQFVLTGEFVYGSRKRVEAVFEGRGAECSPTVSRRCGFLIVGTLLEE